MKKVFFVSAFTFLCMNSFCQTNAVEKNCRPTAIYINARVHYLGGDSVELTKGDSIIETFCSVILSPLPWQEKVYGYNFNHPERRKNERFFKNISPDTALVYIQSTGEYEKRLQYPLYFPFCRTCRLGFAAYDKEGRVKEGERPVFIQEEEWCEKVKEE